LGSFTEAALREEAPKLDHHLIGDKCGRTIQRQAYTAVNGAHGKVEAVESKRHHQKRLLKINSLMETITAVMSNKHANVRVRENAEL
jgi:hypothetical protein